MADFRSRFFSPNFQAVNQQDDKLSVLHANGHHLPVGAIGRTPGRTAQAHLVEQFLHGYKESSELSSLG